jgi:hypothetical protein
VGLACQWWFILIRKPLSERTLELPTAPLPELTSPLTTRPDRRCPTPRARPVRSRRRRVRAVDATVYTAAPVSVSPPCISRLRPR